MKKIITSIFATAALLLVSPSPSFAGSQTYTNGAGGWVAIPAGVVRVTFIAQGGAGGNCGANSIGGGGGAFASKVSVLTSAPILAVGGGGGGGYCLSGGAGGTTASGNGAGLGGAGVVSFGGKAGVAGSVGTGGAGGNISDATTVYYYGGAGGAGGSNGGNGQGGMYNYFCGNPSGVYTSAGVGGYGSASLAGGEANLPSGVASGGGGGGYGGGGGGAGYGGIVDCAGTEVVYRGGGGGGGSYSNPNLSAPSPTGRSILLSTIGNPTQIYLRTGIGGLTSYSGVRAPGGTITMSWPNPGTANTSSNIPSSWTITGPMTIIGSGTSQSVPAAPGTYTITWGAVSGYTTPAPQSLTLASLGTIAFAGNYVPLNVAPAAPTVSGPVTTPINTTQTYSFVSTDPESDQIRYGIDWDMNGVADVWVPAGLSYVNSGTQQSATYSWTTSGAKTFQVLAQDVWGLNSTWRTYNVTVDVPTCANETNNYPTCTQCPDNQAFLVTHCVYCGGTGGCTGVPGGTVSNPNGGLVCNNGALTPAYCSDCSEGMYYTGSSCVACGNGGCSGTGVGLTCNNGTIDPPACITPALPSCDNDTSCEVGETFQSCPNDCRLKYQQF